MVGQCNIHIFSALNCGPRVKMHYPRGNIYLALSIGISLPFLRAFPFSLRLPNLTACRSCCYVERLYWAHSLHWVPGLLWGERFSLWLSVNWLFGARGSTTLKIS